MGLQRFVGLMWLGVVLISLLQLAIPAAIIFIAIHFVRKFW